MTGNVFAANIIVLFVTVGCQPEPEPLPEVTVSIPDQIQLDGVSWQKQSGVQPSDNACLAKFFARNQERVGSPEFAGQPAVLTSGQKDRRFYWLKPAIDGLRWRCIEFRKGKFTVTDGTENPFE